LHRTTTGQLRSLKRKYVRKKSRNNEDNDSETENTSPDGVPIDKIRPRINPHAVEDDDEEEEEDDAEDDDEELDEVSEAELKRRDFENNISNIEIEHENLKGNEQL
jgi:hypothetical protein